MRLAWTWTVPFGEPVEPEEYSQKQASSAVVGAGGEGAARGLEERCERPMPGDRLAGDDDVLEVRQTESRGANVGAEAPRRRARGLGCPEA